MDPQPSSKVSFLKNLYLYLVSFVALMMIVFSVADVINIVLRTYVFTKADKDFYSYPQPACLPASRADAPPKPGATSTDEKCVISAEQQKLQEKQNQDNRTAQKQRDLVRDLSMIIVGLPLFVYHWKLARKKE